MSASALEQATDLYRAGVAIDKTWKEIEKLALEIKRQLTGKMEEKRFREVEYKRSDRGWSDNKKYVLSSSIFTFSFKSKNARITDSYLQFIFRIFSNNEENLPICQDGTPLRIPLLICSLSLKTPDDPWNCGGQEDYLFSLKDLKEFGWLPQQQLFLGNSEGSVVWFFAVPLLEIANVEALEKNVIRPVERLLETENSIEAIREKAFEGADKVIRWSTADEKLVARLGSG